LPSKNALMVTFSMIACSATWLWFVATALILSRIDLREHRLPNPIVVTAYLGGILGFAVVAITDGDLQILVTVIAGSAIASFAYLVIHLVGGMGMGDVKYSAVVGLYLGSLGWAYIYVGSLISFACAALWAMILMFSRRERRNVPFGPFMALGVLVSGVIALGVSAAA